MDHRKTAEALVIPLGLFGADEDRAIDALTAALQGVEDRFRPALETALAVLVQADPDGDHPDRRYPDDPDCADPAEWDDAIAAARAALES